jgi:hypothetical protein
VLEVKIAERNAHAIAGTDVPGELTQIIRTLMKKQELYKYHLLSLKTERAETIKLVQGLKVGEVAIVRDFVNHHDHGGAHVKSLFFVAQFRTEDDGPLHLLKITNYCSDAATCSTDSYFYRDVVAFHLSQKGDANPGHFDWAKRVFFIGDHGPHFASKQAMYFESTCYRLFGKEIVPAYLTSYHACGRADGVGATNKKLELSDFRAGIPRHGAESYAAMTNASNYRQSIAYEYPKINRTFDLFPPENELKGIKLIKKWCQVKYEYPGRREDTEATVLYRPTSNVGPLKWGDLRSGRARDGGPLCSSCSTKDQLFVCHERADCPNFVDVAILGEIDFRLPVLPDPGRIIGLQVSRSSKVKKGGITFPCKFPGCSHATNKRKAWRGEDGNKRANRHMTVEHSEWSGLSVALYPVVAAAPIEGIEGADSGGGGREIGREVSGGGGGERSGSGRKSGARGRGGSSWGTGGGARKGRGRIESDDGGDDESESGDEEESGESENSDEEGEGDEDEEVEAGEEEFVAERILKHKMNGNKRVYLVKWRGYPASENSWEPMARDGGSGLKPQFVEDYHDLAISMDASINTTSSSSSNTHTHTQIHTHTRTYTHTHTHIHTHTQICIHTRANRHTNIYVHARDFIINTSKCPTHFFKVCQSSKFGARRQLLTTGPCSTPSSPITNPQA